MENRKVNLSVNEGMEFFAHELSVNFNPLQFIFDFKTVTPRVDMRSKDTANLLVRHNVVLTDPYHAKRIYELLGNVIETYEKQFGKIEKPKALKKYEKDNKKKKDNAKNKTIAPNYMG